MSMLVDAFAFWYGEDMLDGAMVLLLWSEMVRYQCQVRFLDVKVLRSGDEKIETDALLYVILCILCATSGSTTQGSHGT